MIKRFRKKPVEIEAYQITRELLCNVLFDGGEYPPGLTMKCVSANPECRCIIRWQGEVITLQGERLTVVEGDWIIVESNGINSSPCKPDIFNETYELVD